MQSLENVNLDLNSVAVGSILGITLVYRDHGVPFAWPPQDREAVVIGIEASEIYGHYLVVRTPGLNLPQRITPEQIIRYQWTRETA